jgi:hypothetical protein
LAGGINGFYMAWYYGSYQKVLMKFRFQEGDVVLIEKYWDQSDSTWRRGVVLIKSYKILKNDPSCKAVYNTKCLSGDTTWISYNTEYFDKLPYLVWLGNINENPGLKVLYGT